MGTEELPKPSPELFGARLKQALTKADMTQMHLAEAVGRARSSATRWLGGALPDADTLADIARVLNVSPRWLAGMSEESDRAHEAGELRRLRQRVLDLERENAALREASERAADLLGRAKSKTSRS